MNLETLKQKMDQAHYIYDDTLAVTLHVALALGRPLLIEGAAGVGKTEIAKVMAVVTVRIPTVISVSRRENFMARFICSLNRFTRMLPLFYVF